MHKKFFKLFIMLTLALLLVANNASANEMIKIVTTSTIFKDMASNVAGDKADVVSITKPGADIHTYQPTPGDILKAQEADLILWNGLNLELWFEKFFQNINDIESAILSDGIKPIGIKGGAYNGKPNPHAWMSPEAGKIYINNIKNALIKIDPKNKNYYTKNAQNYIKKIDLLIEPIKKIFANIPIEERWLVTSEGAFSYLARDFKLKELYLWPMNSDSQGTPSQVKNVIDNIRKYKIGVIFSESTVSPKPAIQIAKETGILYGGILFVDSLSDKNGPVPTYLDLIKVTSERIAKNLKRSIEKIE